jgi:hypothetical protein
VPTNVRKKGGADRTNEPVYLANELNSRSHINRLPLGAQLLIAKVTELS